MVRYEYQTCLRMNNTLKDDMTDICDEYHIYESDLMRRAIVQFAENIKRDPDQTSRYMFAWCIARIYNGKRMLRRPLRYHAEGSFPWISDNLNKGSGKHASEVLRICGITSFHPDLKGGGGTGKSTQTPHSPHFLSEFPYEKSNHHYLPKPCSWLQYECYMGNIG